ncbi:MAG: hypothetical protein JWM25_500, partial [Thermoleophilia bacterium]|nr:hypothetical protein [Thermoleophilia bacterium]
GQVASGLAAGPNALTGKPGSNWMSAWFLAQRINGKTEGKLLPTWLTSGPVATGIEWALQGYQFLDLGKDIATVKNYINKTPLPAVNPDALAYLTKRGMDATNGAALVQLGTEIRNPGLLNPAVLGSAASQLVDGTGRPVLLRSVVETAKDAAGNAVRDSAGKLVLQTNTGLTMVPKAEDLHKAIAATDPIQSKGLNVKNAIDSGMGKGLGMLRGLIQPAMIGASALSLISSTMTVKSMVEKNGAKSLVNTQQGRGAALGAISGAGFLGMYLVPMAMEALKVANPAVAAASAAINIGSTILGGVQMLNSYGLFGGEGFLNKDAFRAIFLIPPLTPLGAFGFYMKHKKEEAEKANAKLEAAQKYAVAQVQQQREMVKLQLQNGGSVAGATPAADGSINVTTSIPTDMSLLVRQLNGQVPTAAAPPAAAAAPAAAPATAAAPAAAAPEGASALEQQREQLNMSARPMR